MWDLKRYSRNTALVEGETSYTYEELDCLTEQIAAGVKPRSLVFILCKNVAGSIAGYVSFVNHNIVPLLLDAEINDGLLKELMATYRPRYIWLPEEKAADFPDYDKVNCAAGYCLIDTKEDVPFPMQEQLGVLISTSGSTGSPKLVRQTYENLKANTESIVEYLRLDENECAVTTLPMNYVYGLSVINTHLYVGAKLVLTSLACYSKKFWELFRESEATSFAGVPFMYEMLDKLRFTKKMDLPTMRYMTQAGGKLSPELQEKFSDYCREHGKEFIVMYGASEATARMGYLPFEFSQAKRGSMGKAIPGGRFELVDEEGKVIESSNTTGELVYYGKNVTLGYAVCGDDLIKEDENKGRLATGDMAYRDEDGFYFIVGRKKRFIKMLGKRTNLDEMDGLLKKEFQSIDIACAGHDDLLGVFIINESLKEPIVDYIYKTIGINRNLIRVAVLPEIPKNPSGKILYNELNKLME